LLYIFSGLPGTGKSTIAKLLAKKVRAVYLRIDTIEHAIRQAELSLSGPEGYIVAYSVAKDNLQNGKSVVADSVNPIALTRNDWRKVAVDSGFDYVDIEVFCSDLEEHKFRVESRKADIPGFKLPTWKEVTDREFQEFNTERVLLDTAGKTIEASFEELLQKLNLLSDK
jgi:predicted kinase